MSLNRPAVKISGIAVLAALSVIFQAIPPLFVTPWQMRIDLVAIPWVLCWIFYGVDSALLCLIISVPIVGLIGPFAGQMVGATMKTLSSVWMFTIPALFFSLKRHQQDKIITTGLNRNKIYKFVFYATIVLTLFLLVFRFYIFFLFSLIFLSFMYIMSAIRITGQPAIADKKKLFIIASIIALVIRSIVMIFFNFYYALPVYFGLTAESIIGFFSSPSNFIGHSLGLVGFSAFIAEITFWNTLQGIIDMYFSFIIGVIILQRLPSLKE